MPAEMGWREALAACRPTAGSTPAGGSCVGSSPTLGLMVDGVLIVVVLVETVALAVAVAALPFVWWKLGRLEAEAQRHERLIQGLRRGRIQHGRSLRQLDEATVKLLELNGVPESGS